MKKILFLILLATLFVVTPVFIGTSAANTPVVKKSVVKKVVKKPAPKKAPKKVVKGAKFIPYVFTGVNAIVNCAMPDGKTIKAKKVDCDAVTAFWNKHKPSSPSNNSGGGSNNNNGGSNNNSNNGNNNPPVIGTPTVTSVTVMPCGSSSCHGITTIKVSGTGFTAATRLELIGSGVVGSYMGGDYSTYLLTDFINLPAGTYSARIYSYNGNINEVTVVSAVIIN